MGEGVGEGRGLWGVGEGLRGDGGRCWRGVKGAMVGGTRVRVGVREGWEGKQDISRTADDGFIFIVVRFICFHCYASLTVFYSAYCLLTIVNKFLVLDILHFFLFKIIPKSLQH